jgi:hypothetical protein
MKKDILFPLRALYAEMALRKIASLINKVSPMFTTTVRNSIHFHFI